MTDAKTQAKPATKPTSGDTETTRDAAATFDTQAEATKAREAHESAASSPQDRLLVLGRLRRDTMVLGSSDDEDEVRNLASSAVREGRASEVFVIPVVGYFTENEVDFQPPKTAETTRYADQSELRVPLLNPGTGEDALDAAAASKPKPPTADTPKN